MFLDGCLCFQPVFDVSDPVEIQQRQQTKQKRSNADLRVGAGVGASTKSCPSQHKVISEPAQSHIGASTKSCPSQHKVMSELAQRHVRASTKSCSNPRGPGEQSELHD